MDIPVITTFEQFDQTYESSQVVMDTIFGRPCLTSVCSLLTDLAPRSLDPTRVLIPSTGPATIPQDPQSPRHPLTSHYQHRYTLWMGR